MRRNLIGFVFAAATLIPFCGSNPRIVDAIVRQSKQTGKNSRIAGLSLDIIVGGPFAFIESTKCASGLPVCLIVAAPDVASHSGMIGVGGGAEIKQFVANGTYNFTNGIQKSATATLDAPVLNANILTVSASGEHLPPMLVGPFATMELPMPREIVPWNADPMQISSTNPVPAATSQQVLATLVILRYDFQDSDNLQMNDASGAFWKPVPEKSGNERVLLIGIVPQDPAANEDAHVHATEAFNAMVKMVGLTRFVHFVDPPPAGFQRNRPLNPASPLPSDLQNIVDPDMVQSNATKAFKSRPQESIFGRINDCKAAALLVTP